MTAATLGLALALVWQYSARPALQLWQQAPDTRARLVQQIAAMQELAQQAGNLQKQPRLDTAQSRQALGRSLQKLGGQMSVDGDRMRARLARVPAAALAAWLQSLGPQTGARLVQASLREEAPGLWSGQLVLELP